MNRRNKLLTLGVTLTLGLLMTASAMAQVAAPKPGLLGAEDIKKVAPAAFFFRGQSATLQARNTSGFATKDGKLVMAGLVDTSGYASSVQEKYQGVFITEVKLKIGGKTLVPGQYGFGFLADGGFLIQDVGANDLLTAATNVDEKLKRPVPLKFVEEDGIYRLYAGKKFVTVKVE